MVNDNKQVLDEIKNFAPDAKNEDDGDIEEQNNDDIEKLLNSNSK